MTPFKVRLRRCSVELLSGEPETAYHVKRLDDTDIGIVSRKGTEWVAWAADGSWAQVETRAAAIRWLGGSA